MAVATSQEELAWYNVIGKFRQKAQEFETMMERLQSQKAIAARDPKLAAEYSTMMNAAMTLQQKIKQIRDATDAVINWLKGVFGFDGLGFVPLIPIAVVVASLAAIGKWVKDAYIFSAKLDKVAALEKQGMSSREAIARVQSLTPASSLFGINTKWLVIGGLSLVLIPIFLPAAKAVFKD